MYEDADRLNRTVLEDICRNLSLTPSEVADLISRSGFSNYSSWHGEINKNDIAPPFQVWGIGLLFVTLISCCAAVGIGLMPLLSRRIYHRVLTFCVGLGVGSLSGSAVFHLLPQAFDLVGDGSNHDYISKSWMAISGIYLFFFVDKFLKFFTEYRKAKKRAAASQSQVNRVTFDNKDRNGNKCECESSKAAMTGSASASSTVRLLNQSHSNGKLPAVQEEEEGEFKVYLDTVDTVSVDGATGEDEKQAHAMCSHDHNVEFHQGDSVIGTVAWMIIFGDGLHNFIDGLSIGAAFSKNVLTGISISLAVLCEEFPHELGDVAILISAGMTMRQALTYNMLSAATCYLGFIIGVVLGELADATPYIFALAGGMFLYISLASMVPEMNNACDRHLSKGFAQGMRAMALQASGVAVGLLAMFLMAYYGGNISVE